MTALRFSLLACTLFTLTTPAQTLTGQAAMGDYSTDAPGVRRKITPADMPKPGATKSTDNGPKIIPRPEGAMPSVPPGFTIDIVAENLKTPRKIIAAPNGDLFIAESKSNRVTAIRLSTDGKVAQQELFAENLSQPFGIAFHPAGPNPTHIYIANTDSVIRFPYKSGDLKASGPVETILKELPGGGQLRGGGHWTRDVIFSADGAKMFVSVGSKSNNDDNPEVEKARAAIHRYNPDGTGFELYATGVRNAVGLAIEPTTGQLWGSVNERDGLGDDLVPDYITSFKEGGFYGWPWYYIGNNQDPKHAGKQSDLGAKAITPDVLIQPHSASLCMTFYTAAQFPTEYRNTAFAAQHGSWNRAKRTGYKIIRVIMKDGQATGEYEDFLTGFVTKEGNVWARPVGIATSPDGALYFTDDASNRIWRVRYTGK